MADCSEVDALSLVNKDKDQIKKKAEEYDYVRFTWANLNGAQGGITYTARSVQQAVDSGVQVYAACTVLGPMSELPNFPEFTATEGNCIMFADQDTFRSVPWVGGKYKTAEVLCESYWLPSETPRSACPRYACRRQLAKLKSAGFTLKSGYEVEFRLEDDKTGAPVYSPAAMLNHTMVSLKQDYLFMVDKYLLQTGLRIVRIHTECGPGVFEITLEPGNGIQAADDTFILRHALKEIAAHQGMLANFMTKMAPDVGGTALHFNHSLWTAEGVNAFYDGSDSHNLSAVARHWIAGLLAHCKALTALCAPSVNCYRSLHKLWSGHTVSWGIDDRVSSFRIRNHPAGSTFIEGRIPTSVSNPYLVMAAHIAAGLDGLTRKLECPPPGHDDKEEIPRTLDEALKALEEDTILVDALGEELVSWFVRTKRQIDLVKLKDSDVQVEDPIAYQAEKDMYSRYV